MTIETELSRIIAAKEDIRDSIEAKGIPCPAGTLIENFAAKVDLLNIAYYGISWDITQSTPNFTRTGNLSWHVTLPIQSKMRRCILRDNGTINYYLGSLNSLKKEDGLTDAITSGTDGQNMVEIPAHYFLEIITGNIVEWRFSLNSIPGYTLNPKHYISAYEANLQRSTNKLSSVINTTIDYRGGNNTSSYDALSNTLLGKPVTSTTETNFRTYAHNRGAGWELELPVTYNAWRRLYFLEYATRNIQQNFNAALTSEGYKQGGLGAGVTTLDGTKWNKFNAYNPFIPMGTTASLGNNSGQAPYTMPFEYDASDAANYKGEWSAGTAYNDNEYVSSGVLLYKCILNAPAGTLLTNTTYYTAQTRTVINVPSYRGIENPFGHIWKWIDGYNMWAQTVAEGGKFLLYAWNGSSTITDNTSTGYNLIGELPRTENWASRMFSGHFFPSLVGAAGSGSTTYYCDYYYTNSGASFGWRAPIVGGYAYYGANAGLVCVHTTYAASNAHSTIGSRLCFLGA